MSARRGSRLDKLRDALEEMRLRAESAEARIASVSGVTREELAKREYERGAASQLDSIADALADLCAAVGALQTQHAEQYEALRAEIERLNGLQPTFPPMPPSGSGLPRYGLRWPPAASGAPLAVEMGDGYWTPWHLAEALRAEMQGDVTLLREALEEIAGTYDDGTPAQVIAEDALAALEEP